MYYIMWCTKGFLTGTFNILLPIILTDKIENQLLLVIPWQATFEGIFHPYNLKNHGIKLIKIV